MIIDSVLQLNKFYLDGLDLNPKITVDATLGNGHDSKWLLNNFPTIEAHYMFDVQEDAMERSKVFLGHDPRLHYILDSHEHMDQYMTSADMIVFNLGYLPGLNKHITTQEKTTIEAIEKSMALIQKGKIISISAYPGHPEGRNEYEALIAFLTKIDQKHFSILQFSFINQKNDPPVLFMIQKKS